MVRYTNSFNLSCRTLFYIDTMKVNNVQAAAGLLFVSAQTIAKFANLFSDASIDPLWGQYPEFL